MGLNEKRDIKITDQMYFAQRIQNYDKRFANTAAYVFAAFAFIEKKQLERNINISFMRGKPKKSATGGMVYSLDDPYSVLDNMPGTPRYWQRKKYELIARLENLGPFTFFFTLSCADKRWNENFTTFLQSHTLEYVIKNGREKCFVDTIPLDEFLEKNESKHEFIRKNILTATLNFNNRVQEFIKNIIMNPHGEMCVEYYNYRVEFQMRGAGHIHGTLWLDWQKLKENMEKNKKSGAENIFDVSLVEEAFKNIKDETFGSEKHKKELQPECSNNEGGKTFNKFDREHEALAAFIDKYCTCTLKDPRTREIVKTVNMHNHTKTCPKFSVECRFWFPRFPSLRTIISTPAEIKFSDPDMATQKLQEATALLKKVKDVLEDHEQMAAFCKFQEENIELYVNHKNVVMKINDIVDEDATGAILTWGSIEEIIKLEYCSHFGDDVDDEDQIDLQNLKELQNFHKFEQNKIPLTGILKERLILILNKAKIEGEDEDQIISNYEEALSISPKRYSVVLKRDIDEINVNNYNPEWIICWDGNMDMQPCLDFFGVITYITDYYMKDDSGTLKFIKEVLDTSYNATIKEKLILVKNTFLTHRQIGESEAYYKLFQHLHLSHSNISAVFAPTGF